MHAQSIPTKSTHQASSSTPKLLSITLSHLPISPLILFPRRRLPSRPRPPLFHRRRPNPRRLTPRRSDPHPDPRRPHLARTRKLIPEIPLIGRGPIRWLAERVPEILLLRRCCTAGPVRRRLIRVMVIRGALDEAGQRGRGGGGALLDALAKRGGCLAGLGCEVGFGELYKRVLATEAFPSRAPGVNQM